MTKNLIVVLCVLASHAVLGQANSDEYHALIKKGLFFKVLRLPIKASLTGADL